LNFDFYDDWEADESDAVLGLANDEREPLLGGQPQRERGMTYGTRQKPPRKPVGRLEDSPQQSNVIHSSSYFGFLERLPFRLGSKSLKYQPSIADLQEHPGSRRLDMPEEDPLLEDYEDASYDVSRSSHRRSRSDTHNSGHTTDSLSSRGDIFPSEDEMDDAVPLDDEFALHLERRSTGPMDDFASSGRRDISNRSNSKLSLLTISSKGSQRSKKHRVTPTEEMIEDSRNEVSKIKPQEETNDDKASIEKPETRTDSAQPSATALEFQAPALGRSPSTPASLSSNTQLSTNTNFADGSDSHHVSPEQANTPINDTALFNAAALPRFP